MKSSKRITIMAISVLFLAFAMGSGGTGNYGNSGNSGVSGNGNTQNNNQNSSKPTDVPDNQSSNTSLETNVSDLSEEELALVVGTYVGEDGCVLIFRNDGTADYYDKSWSDIDKNCTWRYSDNTITWHCGRLDCDIYAEVKDSSSKVLYFKSSSWKWSNESYGKVYDEAKELDVNGCRELIEAKIPGSISNAEKQTEEPSTSISKENAVTVKVISKTNQPADILAGRYSDRVVLVIEVTNNADQAIQGVQGVLTINDLFGKKIISSTCDFTGITIQPGETVTFDDKGLEVNEFLDSHKKLQSENFDDLNFSYKVNSIVYESGNDSGTSTTTGSTDVGVTCTDKTNIQADYSAGRYSAHVQFTFVVENKTDKPIRGIQGVLTVTDLFGKEIKKLNCDFTGTTIPAGQSVTINDKYFEVNEFIDSDVKLYTEEFGDMKYSYKVTGIVYAE